MSIICLCIYIYHLSIYLVSVYHLSIYLQLSVLLFFSTHPCWASPNGLDWSTTAGTQLISRQHTCSHTHARTKKTSHNSPGRYTFNRDASGDSQEEAWGQKTEGEGDGGKKRKVQTSKVTLLLVQPCFPL